MNIFDYIDVEFTDQAKSDFLEKFDKYTPDQIKQYLVEEKGTTPEQAKQAVETVEKMVKPQLNWEKVIPWTIAGVGALIFLRVLGKRR